MLSEGELSLIKNQWIREAFADLSNRRDFVLKVNHSFHDKSMDSIDLFKQYVRYNLKYAGTDSSQRSVSYDFEVLSSDKELINLIPRENLTWDAILRMYRGYNSLLIQIQDSIQSEIEKFEE
ncbi:MAG: hypothetical protein JXR07_04600 [Reichenbachiella sp.]